jgi:hypothetical protein
VHKRGALLGRARERNTWKLMLAPAHWVKKCSVQAALANPGVPPATPARRFGVRLAAGRPWLYRCRSSCTIHKPVGQITKKTAAARMADRHPSHEGGGQARPVDAPGEGMP